jgi:hydrocephalus-inducing protein
MFKFNVEEGILGVGEKIPFKITFCSTILGEFSENFRWRLGGSSEVLQILFTGHVMAPSFSFNADSIDYGKVSYSFPNRQVVKFSNTSTVPFKFQLRIPGDGKLSEKEFDIKPSRDQINPKSTIEIEIIFISLMPRKYDMVMVVDIDGVG